MSEPDESKAKPGMDSERVSIVIPVLNQLHYTKQCIGCLAPDIARGVEVVIINNGSEDGTKEFLDTRKDIRAEHSPENLGCASAWNRGVKLAKGEWIVILNNDVVIDPNWLEAMVRKAEEHQLDIVSPAMREGECKYDFASYAEEYINAMKDVVRHGAAYGPCFMVHRRVFEGIGYFDEKFRVGQFEDADFFRRARQSGFRLGTTGAAFLHHFGMVTRRAIRKNPDPTYVNYPRLNRDYYRKKWKLHWFKRRCEKAGEKFGNAYYDAAHKLRYGHKMVERM